LPNRLKSTTKYKYEGVLSLGIPYVYDETTGAVEGTYSYNQPSKIIGDSFIPDMANVYPFIPFSVFSSANAFTPNWCEKVQPIDLSKCSGTIICLENIML
jgi:hypothetical protein